MQKYAFGAAAIAASVMVQVAGASAINDWNLIVKNKLTSSSEVEGRTMVGQISGTSNYATKLLPTSAYLGSTRWSSAAAAAAAATTRSTPAAPGSLGRRARRRTT